MAPLSIVILGGSGFVGSALASRLVRDGHRVRTLTRNRARHRELLVLPGLELVDLDVHDPALLAEAFRGRDVVVNLVGILNESGRGGGGFRRAHAELARKVVGACRSAGVPRLLHMSSLGADEAGPSHYLRTKGEAERIVREDAGATAWTVFRPSVIFGPGDSFLNRFAALLRLSPVLPLARIHTRFAPVSVEDVVEAMVAALATRATIGATFELCGPEILTLGELVRYVAAVTGRRRLVIGLPDAVGWLQAAALELLPGKPLSLDNFRSLSRDSVCTENGFARLGLAPRSLRTVVPGYLGAAQRAVRLAEFRRETAGRDPRA